MGMPELALDHEERDALVGQLDCVPVAELMLVPTSAQPPLSRPRRYAEVCQKSLLVKLQAPRALA